MTSAARPAAVPPTPSVPRLAGLGLLAFGVTAVLGGIWSVLLVANLGVSPSLPWSVVVMGALLLGTWRFLDGSWGPKHSAEARRSVLRATLPRPAALAWALAAGLSSVVALIGFWIILVQVGNVSPRSLPDYSTYPVLTVAVALAMAAVVGGVLEEAMFRGYFQASLERALGGSGAIAITSFVMAPEHALTQGVLWTTVLFYLAVDVVLGLMAYLTDSIAPGLVVHVLGLAAFFGLVWPGDAGRLPVAQGGADLTFWLHVAQTAGFGFLALVAFYRLARLREAPASAGQSPPPTAVMPTS